MIPPAVAAGRFLAACGIGAGLGLVYGFLRPLRGRLTHLSDALFILAACIGWLWVGFGICGGDLRFGYFAGMLLGGIFWDQTVGKVLRPVFSGFWKGIAFPFQKLFTFFRKKLKKLFAFCKKWVTIGWNMCCHHRQHSGGVSHGKKARQTGISQQAHRHGNRHGAGDRRYHRRSDSAQRAGQ